MIKQGIVIGLAAVLLLIPLCACGADRLEDGGAESADGNKKSGTENAAINFSQRLCAGCFPNHENRLRLYTIRL